MRDCLPPGQTVNLMELNQAKMEMKNLYVFIYVENFKTFFLSFSVLFWNNVPERKPETV